MKKLFGRYKDGNVCDIGFDEKKWENGISDEIVIDEEDKLEDKKVKLEDKKVKLVKENIEEKLRKIKEKMKRKI